MNFPLFRFLIDRILPISFGTLIIMMLISWSYILLDDRQQNHSFFSLETFDRAKLFISDLLGIGHDRTPGYLDSNEWLRTSRLAYDTLLMSLLAIGISAIGALATFMFGARNVMFGTLTPNSSWVWFVAFLVVRMFFAFSRAIPELVWAMLIIFIFSPGILPGAIALGIHNWGILGKLTSEVVEDLDPHPAIALQRAGAGRLKILMYFVLPQALPRFMTYLFYRWEVIIRTTIVVGFVASGGLGMDFRLSMSLFHYTTVALLIAWYLILVGFVDLASAGMRKLAR